MPSSSRFKVLLSALFVFSIVVYHFYPSMEAYQIVESKSTLDTPVMDSLGYKQVRLRLHNGLKVWLISAPNVERSCIGVAVGVGSCDDPLTSMGLSHFCEHMVFFGSEAYPELDGTDSFKAKHNGEHNACTYPDRTVYGFSCASDAWKEAASRMAAMLTAPLMKKEVLERERNAVHEELQKNLSNDSFLALSMTQAQTREDHPLHRLLCGNHETLANVTPEELQSWVKKYYRGGNMAVYAISSLPIEEMIETIEQAFSSLASGQVEHVKWSPLFEDSQTHKQIWSHIPADRALFLSWSIPSFENPKATTFFLQKALTHPYPGGLFATMTQKGWINNSYVELFDLADHNLLYLIYSLTEKGIAEIDQVKALTYDYLEFLKSTPWPEVWLNECQNAKRIDWQMHVNDPSLWEAIKYASMVYKQPLETFPDKTYCPSLESFQQAQAAIGYMQASSCIEIALCPQTMWPENIQKEAAIQENWHIDPWIGTRYLKLEASQATSKKNAPWSLPQNNPLFPITVELPSCPSKDEFAYQEYASESGSLRVFNNPSEASSRDSLIWAWRPFTNTQRELSALDEKLYWSILAEILNQDRKIQRLTFEARTAGQSLRLAGIQTGLEISLTGYCSPVQEQILTHLLQVSSSLQLTKSSFQYVHKYLCDSYEVLMHAGPIELLDSSIEATCLQDAADPQTSLNALKAISFERFQSWIKKLLQTPIRHDFLVVSSRPMENWISLFESLSKQNLNQLQEEGLQAPNPYPFQKHWKEIVELSHPYSHVRNGVLVVHLWPSLALDSQEALESYYCLQMLEPDFAKGAFHSLRTEQQLGYGVKGLVKLVGDKPTLVLLVLSSAYDERYVSKAMETYAQNFAQSLSEISDETFESMKKRLLFRCHEPSTNSQSQLNMLAASSWQLGLDPKGRQERLTMIEKITKERYIELMLAFLKKQPISIVLSPATEPAPDEAGSPHE